MTRINLALLFLCLLSCSAFAQNPRSRDLGIIIGKFQPGPWNAITDVAGVKVGHTTLRYGNRTTPDGKGPARTGVTVVLPAEGDLWNSKIFAGSFVLNGNGEAMGLMYLQETEGIETPIALTNTFNIGVVQKALVQRMLSQHPQIGRQDDTSTPVVLECDDGGLNDIRNFYVKERHVWEALDRASSGPVAEGAVGAGTGMVSYGFKAGIGTSSRLVEIGGKTYTIGVLVNANHGTRNTLRVQGIPVGEMITDLKPKYHQEGSIVILLATDAPLLPGQLNDLSKRVILGLARTGGVAHHGSGDLAIAFSTANRIPHYPEDPEVKISFLSNYNLNPLFEASADATEEAILNSLFAAETTVGRDGNTVWALPQDRLKEILDRYRQAQTK
ncbi:MAG: P1 family peptidase [Bdellovibrionota bacterium]